MATKKNTTGFVSVACALPQGLAIHEVPGVKGGILKLHGANSVYAHFGFGITDGVPEAAWQHVLDKYTHAAWLKNEQVFAYNKPADTRDAAEEAEDDVVTGFEPIDPTANPALENVTPPSNPFNV